MRRKYSKKKRSSDRLLVKRIIYTNQNTTIKPIHTRNTQRF